MKMYVWDSEYMAEWTDGLLIGLGNNVAEAREALQKEFKRHVKEDLEWAKKDKAYYKMALETATAAFEADIADPPMYSRKALFVRGSS